MSFYSTIIDINDRRLYTLELLERNNEAPLPTEKTFVIDIDGSSIFKILSIKNSDTLKSFVIDQSDKQVNLSQISATRDGYDIRIIIDSDYNIPTAAPTAEPMPDVRDDEDISLDDIDEFVPYEKKKIKTTPTNDDMLIPEVKRDIIHLGRYNEYLDIRLEINGSGLRLDGVLTGRIPEEIPADDVITITMLFISDGRKYSNKIKVALSHPSEYLGIALDFGSESSQMAISRYEATTPYALAAPDTEHLFRNVFNYHRYSKWIEDVATEGYYQEEEGTNFYKSLFFLKQKLDGDYDDIHKKSFLDKQEQNLKMLVAKGNGFNEMSKQYLQLPNLKILHDHDNILDTYHFETRNDNEFYPVDLKLKELKHQVYNSILETMIVSVLMKEFSKFRSAARNIRMMLLVPNNYDVKNIHTIQEYLTQIFDNLKAKEFFSNRIKSVEVITISESDASFIGYMNKEGVQVKADRDYIIIDSGKGTTDFSIIRTGQKNIHNLSSVYRNGFTGAGNLITYAIFETVIHYLRSVSPDDGSDISFIQRQIVQSLKDNDLKSRNDFFQALERLKYNYRDVSEKDAILKNWQQVSADTTGGATRFATIASSGGTIQNLTELLNRVGGITDFYGYIDEACTFIANSVTSYLQLVKHHKDDLHIQGTILTGRAFRFRPLASIMKDRLSQDLAIQNIELLQGNELKDICIQGVFNKDIKINAEHTGYPIQVIYKNKEDIPQEETQTAKQKKTRTNIFQRAIGFFVDDLASLEQISEIRTVKDQIAYSTLQHSEFIIGCKRYNIKNDDNLDNTYIHTDASIDFTQDGYKVRKMQHGRVVSISKLSEKNKANNTNPALITPSLFPNYLNEDYIQSLEKTIQKNQHEMMSKDAFDDDDLFRPSPGHKPSDDSLFF